MIQTTIYGHNCVARIYRDHGAGTYDVEILACETCPDMVGKYYRVSGLPLHLELSTGK